MPVATRVARHFGLPQRSAVHVLEIVPESPAARAGLRAGDRIIGLDDTVIDGVDGLQRVLDAGWIGRSGELKVLRGSSLIKLRLKPTELPAA